MKFLGESKNKVEAAKSEEEISTVLAQAGIELTDEIMEKVSGGNKQDGKKEKGNGHRPYDFDE